MKLSEILRVCIVATIFLVSGSFPSPATAQIYMRIDKDGVRHFTNIPMASEDEEFRFEVYKKGDARRAAYGRYSANIESCIEEASRLHGVSRPLLRAVIKVESDFNPRAVSKKGAVGLMQIMPFNFKLLSIDDPYDPWQNIMGGAKYLKFMLNRFDNDLSLSLAAYNAGPNAVEKYGRIPPYPETTNYVRKVLYYYSSYKGQG